MILRKSLLISLAILFTAPKTIVGQDDSASANGFGPTFNPAGTFQSSKIDNVDLGSGNVQIKIPLFSLPQRGSFKTVNFSLVANTAVWGAGATCYQRDSDGYYVVCYTSAVPADAVLHSDAPPFGVQITNDILMGSGYVDQAISSYDGGYESPAQFYTWTIVDDTFGAHQAIYNTSNPADIRTVDGSGYLLKFDTGDSWYDANNMDLGARDRESIAIGHSPTFSGEPGSSSTFQPVPPPKVYDRYGHHTVFSLDSNSSSISYGEWYTSGVTDPDGNTIVFPHSTTSYSDPGGITTDTLGRHLHLDGLGPGSVNNNTNPADVAAHCPNLGVSSQPAVAYSIFNFVETYGSSSTSDSRYSYTACYALISAQTDIFGGGAEETDWGGGYLIQSVVLPDGSHWGFLYDNSICSGSPASCTTAYANVTKVITPESGAISYCYENLNEPGSYGATGGTILRTLFVDPNTVPVTGLLPILTRRMEQTTAGTNTDACSAPSNYWSYSIVPADQYDSPTGSTTVIDPVGNKTVLAFDHAGAETSEDIYQLLGGSYTLLQHKTLVNGVEGNIPNAPYITSYYSYKTEEDDSQNGVNVGKILWSYTSGGTDTFTGGIYVCYVDGQTSEEAYGCPGFILPTTMYIGNLNRTTVYDSTGAVLKESNTIYQSEICSGYQEANFLNLIYQNSQSQGTDSSYTSNSFDGASYGGCVSAPAIKGHETTTSPTYSLTTHMDWDSHGMLSDVIDPRGTTSRTITYDSTTHAFPVSVTTPIGIDTYTYDDLTDLKVASHTDPNGKTTSVTYDEMGRPWTMQYPDTSGGKSEVACYPDANTVTVYQAQGAGLTQPGSSSSCPSASGNTKVSTSQADGLGRIITSAVVAPEGTIKTDMAYDAVGNVYSVSNPYIGSPTAFTYTTYDALARPLIVTKQDLTTNSWVYSVKAGSSGNPNLSQTTAKDENNNYKTILSDFLGRNVEVDEPLVSGASPTSTAKTQYTYTLFGLNGVTQSGNGSETIRSRSFNYDEMGRLTTATNPEAGGVTYIYSVPGSICAADASLPCSKTDARGVTISYHYDLLNRLLSKTYSDGTASACYQYDVSPVSGAGTNLIGRLTNAWTQSGSTCPSAPPTGVLSRRSILAYDPVGRILNEQQCTKASCTGTVYTPSYTYDLAGNVLNHTSGIASGTGSFTFTNSYDAVGRLASVVSSNTHYSTNLFTVPLTTSPPSAGSQSCNPTATTPGYSPAGSLMNATFGSGLQLSRSYDVRLRANCEVDMGNSVLNPTPGTATLTINGTDQSH